MKCIHLNEQWDSITEACMAAWVHEAKALGYVDDWYPQVEYLLSLGVQHTVAKQLKTKVRYDSRTLLQPARYTADFVVALTRASIMEKFAEAGLLVAGVSGERNIYSTNDSAVYVIDIKGDGGRQGAADKFSLTQKFLHESTGVFVNRLIPCIPKPCQGKKVSDQAYALKHSKWLTKKAEAFFSVCGLPAELPQECYLNDGSDFRQPWRDMFAGCVGIEEAMQ